MKKLKLALFFVTGLSITGLLITPSMSFGGENRSDYHSVLGLELLSGVVIPMEATSADSSSAFGYGLGLKFHTSPKLQLGARWIAVSRSVPNSLGFQIIGMTLDYYVHPLLHVGALAGIGSVAIFAMPAMGANAGYDIHLSKNVVLSPEIDIMKVASAFGFAPVLSLRFQL